jgi:hypothetical protein
MAADKFDYASVINDIKAKITALQAILTSVESAAALGALGQPIEGIELSTPTVGNADLGVPTDLPKGAFIGKSLPACIELYLSAVKKKKTNREIAVALREEGVESNAKHFDNVVTGALFGLKKAGKVLRFKDGWGLAEWYPAHIRAVPPAKSSKRAKKSGWKKKLNAKIDAKFKEMKSSAAQPEPKKANERALDLLRSKPGMEYGLEDVGSYLGMGIKGARLILGKLVKAGKAEKTPQDKYRATRPQ